MPDWKKIINFASLNTQWQSALKKYMENGAVKKVGPIESAKVKTKGDEDPVHQSHYNRQDKEDVISVQVWPEDGSKPKTHHVYADGTGTFKKGDRREYSTTAGRRA